MSPCFTPEQNNLHSNINNRPTSPRRNMHVTEVDIGYLKDTVHKDSSSLTKLFYKELSTFYYITLHTLLIMCKNSSFNFMQYHLILVPLWKALIDWNMHEYSTWCWFMSVHYITINVLLFPLVHNINTLETYKIV